MTQSDALGRRAFYDTLRRRSLYSFIAFLALSALFAIWAVLVGDFGWLQARVLITTLTISGASIDCMGCAVALEKRGQHGLPLAGIALAITAGILIIFGAWAEVNANAYWKLTAITTAFAIAATHTSLLGMIYLAPSQRWLYRLAQGTIFGVATLVAIAILGEVDSLGYYRIMIVVAIVVALLTLVIPILGRLDRPDEVTPNRLQLTQVDGDVYRGDNGQLYRLSPIHEQEQP